MSYWLSKLIGWPFYVLRYCTLKTVAFVVDKTTTKTTYRGMTIYLDECSGDVTNLEFETARDVIDLFHERSPRRMERFRQYVDHLFVTPRTGTGLYVPETRTFCIDLSSMRKFEAEEQSMILDYYVAILAYHATIIRLNCKHFRVRKQLARRVSAIEVKELKRCIECCSPWLSGEFDWSEFADESQQERADYWASSIFQRMQENWKVITANPLASQ